MSENVQTSLDKSGSSIAQKSLKVVSSVVKSLSSLKHNKSQSVKLETASAAGSNKSVLRDIPDSDKNDNEKNATGDEDDESQRDKITSIVNDKDGTFEPMKMRPTKFMRKYPELFRDDASINPSYTGLLNYPYHVVCRRRCHKNKLRIDRQLKREIDHITMMQTLALDGVRVGRIFTIGFPPSATSVPDFSTPKERQRINEMLSER